MLSLNLKSGDYITIGDKVVVQVFKEVSRGSIQVLVDAPREISILRGELLEKDQKRPDSVIEDRPRRRSASDRRRTPSQLEKLEANREYFDGKRKEAEEEKAAFLQKMREVLDRQTQLLNQPQTKKSELRSEVEAMHALLDAFADTEVII